MKQSAQIACPICNKKDLSFELSVQFAARSGMISDPRGWRMDVSHYLLTWWSRENAWITEKMDPNIGEKIWEGEFVINILSLPFKLPRSQFCNFLFPNYVRAISQGVWSSWLTIRHQLWIQEVRLIFWIIPFLESSLFMANYSLWKGKTLELSWVQSFPFSGLPESVIRWYDIWFVKFNHLIGRNNLPDQPICIVLTDDSTSSQVINDSVYRQFAGFARMNKNANQLSG